MRLSGFWALPYHPARAFLLERGLCLFVCCDAWLLMLEHGGRYGAGGFNVAHFRWLDVLVPVVEPALYGALVSAVGLLALAGALFEVSRFNKALLAALYTLAWALSMHDSYQHHYLLSWLLSFQVVFPLVGSRDASSSAALVRAPGFPLSALSCAILYLFTAVSKTSPEWLSGDVLRVLARPDGQTSSALTWLPRALAALSVTDERAWQIAALSTLVLQVVITIGYCLAAARDTAHGRWIAWVCSAAWGGSVLFHVLTELTEAFAIGWFSYYMLWISTAFFAPAGLLRGLCVPIAWLRERIAGLFAEHTPSLALAVGCSCLVTLLVAQKSDLPGVSEACAAILALFLVQAGMERTRRRRDAALRCAVIPGMTMIGLFAALTLTSVRFDYYRRAAGESWRMSDLTSALELYRKAERHAPRGKSRMTKIDELERVLSEQDAGQPRVGEP